MDIADTQKDHNLLDSPWIKVKTLNGELLEIGAKEFFENAHTYEMLAGETPQQNISVLRKLLSILYATFQGKDINGEKLNEYELATGAVKLWGDIWQLGHFPYEHINTYLESYRERFYLFHPSHPFFGITGLDKLDQTKYNMAKMNSLILESNNSASMPRVFSSRSGKEKYTMSFSEATRSLLFYNDYAEFFNNLYKGEKRQYPDGTKVSLDKGWVGSLGLVCAIGNNVFQTLMYNLVMLQEIGKPWTEGTPLWEKEINTKECCGILQPITPVELFTLQSRRIQLNKEKDRVVSFQLVAGDFFQRDDVFAETMTTRKSIVKKGKATKYRPSPFDPSMQTWRNLPSMIVQGDIDNYCQPLTVWWIAFLRSKGIIPQDEYISFMTSGITYNSGTAVVDMFSGTISFCAGLFEDLLKSNSGWLNRICLEIKNIERFVEELGVLAQSIAKAEGVKDAKYASKCGLNAKAKAMTSVYFDLDHTFQEWLESINPATDDIDKKCDELWTSSQRTVRKHAKDLMNNCTPQALIGKRGQSAALSYNNFLSCTKAKAEQ